MDVSDEYAQSLRELEVAKSRLARESATSEMLTATIERMATPCIWFEGDEHGKFDTGCGAAFTFTDDGIEENGFNNCPYCGGRITA